MFFGGNKFGGNTGIIKEKVATRFIKGGKMSEELDLFYVDESYDLSKLKQICQNITRKKFPTPVDGEDFQDYELFIREETDLLFAQKMREEADRIEQRILGTQKKIIQTLYRK